MEEEETEEDEEEKETFGTECSSVIHTQML